MFHINSITLPPSEPPLMATINQVRPVQRCNIPLGERLGPEGSAYTIVIQDMGVINLVDIGNRESGPDNLAVQFNESVNWLYQGEGQMTITVGETGDVTIDGGNGPAHTHCTDEVAAVNVAQD